MWVAVILFIFILGLLAYLDTRKPKNYPPGPNWLPILGSALTVAEARKKAGYLYIASAQMADKYGPVMGLKVGRDLVVIAYGYQALKEFSLSDDLSGRPVGEFFNLRTWGERLGVMLTDSGFWQEQRRFMLRQLREFGFGRKNMSIMIEDEAAFMVQNIKEMIGSKGHVTVDMEDQFNIHVLNTLWTMMASVRYNPEDKGLKELQGILGQLFATIDMVGAPFSQFPILKFIAPQLSGYSLYIQTHTQVWDFLKKEIKRHKETHDPEKLRDFMDVYINIIQSSKGDPIYTEKQLLALCMDMFMAGSETTSKSLGFMFLYLLLYPDVQKKVQEEIDRVIGRDRIPSLNDRPNMPYMEATVLEALRMFSGRAFTVPHRAMKDTELCGYFIPKDAIVVGNLHGALMREECGYPDPEVFRPERYIKGGKITQTETYIPFGFGRRRCMGETLARANLFIFTAAMLQNFDFTIPPGCPPSMECTDGVTPGPKHFKACISPRTVFYT